MDLHHQALRRWNIDPDTAPGLTHIYNEKPGTPFSGHPYYIFNYQHICKQVFKQILYSEELDTVINGYFRSPSSTEAQYADVFKMLQPPVTIIKDDAYNTAFNRVVEMFRPTKPVRVVHYVDTQHYPWPTASSVERPYSTDPKVKEYVRTMHAHGLIPNQSLTFGNLKNYVYDSARPIIHAIKDGQCFTGNLNQDHVYPMVAHFRPGLGKPGSPAIKNRLVWGVSKILLISECMFMYPLFNDYLRHGTSPLLWGYETILGGWTRLYNEIHPIEMTRECTVITADWSEFDHRVSFELIEAVIMASWSYYDIGAYAPDHRYSTYENCKYDSQRIFNLFRWTIYATLSSPLVMPDGKVWMRTRNGIPSGTFRTQWLDSMINAIMLTTVFQDVGLPIDNNMILKVLGDDSLSVVFKYTPPSLRAQLKDDLAKSALRRFNAKLSLDKTEILDSLHTAEVLGYRNYYGSAFRDPLKLLAQLLYPESESPTYSSLMGRCVGIAYADLGRHPNVYRICKRIYTNLTDKGYSPNPTAATRLLSGSKFIEQTLGVDVTHFPTVYQIQEFTRFPYVRSQADNDAYWNPQVFTDDFSDDVNFISVRLGQITLA